MALNGIMKKVSDTKDKVVNLTIESSEQVSVWIEEYKQAVRSLQIFGFTVGKIRVAASPFPEISTSINGSFKNLDGKRLGELLEANKEQKLLAAIYSTLLTVTKLQDVVDMAGLHDVSIQITLGVPPKILVDLQ